MSNQNIPIPEVEKIPSSICSTITDGFYRLTSCFSSCCSGFFYTKPSPKLLASKNVTQKLKDCLEIVANQENDMEIIRIALKSSRTDVRASYIETTMLLHAPQSQYTLCQPLAAYNKNIEHRADMLEYLSELLDTYPALEPDNQTSLDKLNMFYNDRNSHHQKVMTLVETYLPETYSALKEAQPVLRNQTI